jgi:hypothetical protein
LNTRSIKSFIEKKRLRLPRKHDFLATPQRKLTPHGFTQKAAESQNRKAQAQKADEGKPP